MSQGNLLLWKEEEIIINNYKEIRNKIGKEKYNQIAEYLGNSSISFDKFIVDFINWQEFDKWYYKNIKKQEVEIIGTWITDYDDIAFNAILYKDNKKIAHIIDSFDEFDIRYKYGDINTEFTDEFLTNSGMTLINEKFDSYMKLPRISQCSKLLSSIYEQVCYSESAMCHIDQRDWDENYVEDYSEEDIDKLKDEIRELSLEDVIEVFDSEYITGDGKRIIPEYRIVGYGDLQMRFNDDRNLMKYVDNEIENQDMVL